MALEQAVLYDGPYRYPVDYRIFRIGEYLALKFKQEEAVTYVQVTGVEKLFPKTYQDTTNWLLASAGTFNKDNLSDLLDGHRGQLGLIAMGVDCDREIEVRMFMPESNQRGGHKKKSLAVFTPLTSPFYTPTIKFPIYMAEHPSWELYNRTEYTVRWAYFSFIGYRYEIKKAKGVSVASPPRYFETVQFEGID